jgi:hypothetical protein
MNEMQTAIYDKLSNGSENPAYKTLCFVYTHYIYGAIVEKKPNCEIVKWERLLGLLKNACGIYEKESILERLDDLAYDIEMELQK